MLFFRSDKPVLLARFMPRAGVTTEPSMDFVVPAEQYKSSYEFVVPDFTNDFTTYVQVIYHIYHPQCGVLLVHSGPLITQVCL